MKQTQSASHRNCHGLSHRILAAASFLCLSCLSVMFCFMYGGVACWTPQPSHGDHPHLTIITNHAHLYIFPSHSTFRRQIVNYTYLAKLSSDLSSPFLVFSLFSFTTRLSSPAGIPVPPNRRGWLPVRQSTRPTISGSPQTFSSALCSNKLVNCYQPLPVVICAVRLGSPRLAP